MSDHCHEPWNIATWAARSPIKSSPSKPIEARLLGTTCNANQTGSSSRTEIDLHNQTLCRNFVEPGNVVYGSELGKVVAEICKWHSPALQFVQKLLVLHAYSDTNLFERRLQRPLRER